MTVKYPQTETIDGKPVDISGLVNLDTLQYDSTTKQWENKQGGGGGITKWNQLGATPFVTVGLLAGAVAAGWDYGPDTSGTTTSGFDEAIAALPAVTLVGQAGNVQTATGGVIYVQNGVGTSFTSAVTIPSGSSLTIIGLTGSFDMNTFGSGFQTPGMTVTTNTGMSTLYFPNTISLPVFSAPNDGSGNSVTRLMMQGIEIRIQNPTALNTGAAVDLSGVTQGTLKDVLIDCTFKNGPGVSGQNIGIGLKMIRTGGDTTIFENLSISNFYQYGAQLSVPNLHIINIDVSDIDTSSGSHAAIYWEVCWFNSIHKAHIFNTYVGIQWIYGLNSADVSPYIGEISFENTELPVVAPATITFPMIINHATFLYKALSTTSNYTGDVKDTHKTTLRSFDWFVNAAPTNGDKTFTTETPGFTPSGTVVHESVDCNIFVTGGTVTDITVDGISTGQTSGRLTIFAGHNWSITYSAVPTVTRIKR